MKPRVQNQEKSDDLNRRVENGSSSRFTQRVVLCVFLLVVVAMLGLSVFLFVDSRNKIIQMEKQLGEFKEQCTGTSTDTESERNHWSQENDDTHKKLDRRVKRRARPSRLRLNPNIESPYIGIVRNESEWNILDGNKRDGNKNGRHVPVKTILKGSYIRWGKTSCTSGGYISGLSSGIISTLHDSNNHPVTGADVVCLPTPNEVTSQSLNSGTGYSLQPLHFRLDSVNPSAYRSAVSANLKCAFCSHSGSTTIMLVGKTSCPHRWFIIYRGIYVAGSGVRGTTSSICLEFDSRYMSSPSIGGNHAGFSIRTSSAFTSASKQIPCIVCSS